MSTVTTSGSIQADVTAVKTSKGGSVRCCQTKRPSRTQRASQNTCAMRRRPGRGVSAAGASWSGGASSPVGAAPASAAAAGRVRR